MKKLYTSILLLFCCIGLPSCTNFGVAPPPLRVGVSPNYKPIIFKDENGIKGMEADFAYALAKELNRSVEFVETPWEQIIPTLNSGKIDIIMSGMSITEERSKLVHFTDPYLTISQMLLVRRAEVSIFRQPGSGYYIKSGLVVGVEKGTTGESLARKYLPESRVISFNTVREATLALKGRHIDCFLHDAPTIWQYIDGRDNEVAGIYWEMGKENLAWALKKSNLDLYRKIRRIMTKWRFEGKTSKIVSKWVPTRVTYK